MVALKFEILMNLNHNVTYQTYKIQKERINFIDVKLN